MKKMQWLCAAVLLLAQACGIPQKETPQGGEKDSYKVSISAENKRIAKIEASFVLKDSILYMSDAGPMPERWPDYVQNILLKNAAGENIALEKTADKKWLAKAQAGEKVFLSYDISLKHDEIEWPGGLDGVAYTKDWGVFYTGRALFVMNGKDRQNIGLDFALPEAWKVSTPWAFAEGKKNAYTVKNLSDLAESLIFAGTHQEFTLKREGVDILFALGGEGIVSQKDKYDKTATQLLEYYTAKMGGLPKPNPKEPLTKMLVVINSSDQVDGEVIGNHISMFINPEGDPEGQLMGWFMFAHEFFHLWNGKTFQPEDTKDDWFKEGITNYYTIKALHSTGFVGTEGVGMMMSRLFYARYAGDGALGKTSVRDAASGFDKDAHWGLIYGGGLFIGISQDAIIRKNTGNQKSLDDLMRDFYRRYGGTEQFYNTEILLKTLSELSGEDQKGFFDKYIYGTEKIPVENYLRQIGFEAKADENGFSMKPQSKPDGFQKTAMEGFYGK